MTENFPVKIDNVGRLVVPKEVRNQLNIKEDIKFSIKEESGWLLFERIESIVAIDHYGRVLVPKKLREKCNIKNDSLILLSETEQGFKIKHKINKYQELIKKLIFLEKNYNLKTILTNSNQTIYTSKKYKILKTKTAEIEGYLNTQKVNYHKKIIQTNNNESLSLYIICEDTNNHLINLIFALL